MWTVYEMWGLLTIASLCHCQLGRFLALKRTEFEAKFPRNWINIDNKVTVAYDSSAGRAEAWKKRGCNDNLEQRQEEEKTKKLIEK